MTSPQARAGAGTTLNSKIGKSRLRGEASQDPVSDHTGHIVQIAMEQKHKHPPRENDIGRRTAMTKQIKSTYGFDENLMVRMIAIGSREDGSCVINSFLRKRLSDPSASLDDHLRNRNGFKDLIRF